MAVTKEQVEDAIKTVVDPENDDKVKVTMTLSTRGCPLHEMMKQWTKDAVEKIDGVNECEVEIVWEPAWNIGLASDEVKKALGAL